MSQPIDQFIKLLKGKPLGVKTDAVVVIRELAKYNVRPSDAIRIAYAIGVITYAIKKASVCSNFDANAFMRRMLRGFNVNYNASFPYLTLRCCGCKLIVDMITRQIESAKCKRTARNASAVLEAIFMELALDNILIKMFKGYTYVASAIFMAVKPEECMYPVIIAANMDEFVILPAVLDPDTIACAERVVDALSRHPLYGEDFARARRWVEYWRRIAGETA